MAFLGFAHNRLALADSLTQLDQWVKSKPFHLVILSDSQLALRATRDPILRVIYQRAHLVLPCGTGMMWASSWKRRYLPERVLRAEWLAECLKRADQAHWRVFIVGKHAESARQRLGLALPNVQWVGTDGRDDHHDHEAELVERINASQPNVLLFDAPDGRAEKWLARNAPRLNVQVGIGIGDLLTEIAELQAPPPDWMQDIGLGWLFRVLQQPKRLRLLWNAPRFILGIVLER